MWERSNGDSLKSSRRYSLGRRGPGVLRVIRDCLGLSFIRDVPVSGSVNYIRVRYARRRTRTGPWAKTGRRGEGSDDGRRTLKSKSRPTGACDAPEKRRSN